MSFVLGGTKGADLSDNIARTDGVRPRKLHPFNDQTFAQMPYSSLRYIVRRLGLRNVYNVPAHAGYCNEATVGEALKLILLLSPELGSRAHSRRPHRRPSS